MPAATSSALTLQTTPSSSRASGATTGTWPPTRIASIRSRRRPTTWATRPDAGDPLGDEQAAVDARQPDRVDAEVAQPGHELAVDDAAQDRGGDFEGGGVGDPEAAFEVALDAEAIQPLGDPLATAVDEHDRPAPGDRGHLVEDLLLIGDRRPTQFDDEDLAHVVYSEFSIT